MINTHSVSLPWTSDQLVPDTLYLHKAQHTQKKDIRVPSGIRFRIFLYSVRQPCFCLCLHSSVFCVLSLLTAHDANIHVSGGIFLFCLFTFYITSLLWLSWLLTFALTLEYTSIRASGRIRTRDSSNRVVPDPRLRPHGHRHELQ